ncbi:MAG: hypothetical protein GSR77_00855 [Desulfurococcales archaeon]|nr:hypothetical protein [Desulfurococcales archaeon]
MKNNCGKHRLTAHLKGSLDNAVNLEAFYHPATCRGIRYPHLDIILPGDDCGIKTYFARSGGSVSYRYHDGLLVVNIGEILGYPCLIEVDISRLKIKIIKHMGSVYVRISRRGNLYVRLPL